MENPRTEKQFIGKPLRWWQRAGGTVLVVSILIHILLAVGAGYFVVQHFSAKPKPVAAPEAPAQRSEQVKVQMDTRQKTLSAPAVKKKVTTNSPLAKVSLPEMPDVPTENVMPSVMPGVSATFGTGPGLGGGGGQGVGQDSTFFGTPGGKIGLLGTFYDFKQSKTRRKLDPVSKQKYTDIMKDFVAKGWKPEQFDQYFKAVDAVASKMILVPQTPAEDGPTAFRMGGRVKPGMWIVHYHGKVTPPVSGRYRFVGGGDDVMLVALDGKLLLDACWDIFIKKPARSFPMHVETKGAWAYNKIPRGMVEGDAFDVVAGKEYSIDVAIGEEPGSFMFAFLLLEKEGVPPKMDEKGFPLFPLLRFANAQVPKVQTRYGMPPFDPAIPPWSIWPVTPPPKAEVDTNSFFH